MKPRTTIQLPNGHRPRPRRVRVAISSHGELQLVLPPGPFSGTRLELQTFCSYQFIPEIIVRAVAPPDSSSHWPGRDASAGDSNRVRILPGKPTSDRKQV